MSRSFLLPLVLIVAGAALFGLGYYAAPKPIDAQPGPLTQLRAAPTPIERCCSMGWLSICGQDKDNDGVVVDFDGETGARPFMDMLEPCVPFHATASGAMSSTVQLVGAAPGPDNENCCFLNPFQTICVERSDADPDKSGVVIHASLDGSARTDLPKCVPNGKGG